MTKNQVFQGFFIYVYYLNIQVSVYPDLKVLANFLAFTGIPELVSNPVKISVSMWNGPAKQLLSQTLSVTHLPLLAFSQLTVSEVDSR